MREGLRTSRPLRAVAAVILFGGLAFLVVRHLQNTPSEVELAVSLGSAAADLVSLELRASRGGDDSSVAFRLRRTFGAKAPRTLRSKLKLVDGDYRVEVDLRYRAAPPKRIRTRATSLGPNAVRLARSMTVRGSGALTIVIGDD